MTIETLYSIIGFLSGGFVFMIIVIVSILRQMKIKHELISQKDEIIQEFSKTVVPLLREMLSYQKMEASQRNDRDNQLRGSIERFGDVVSKLVTVFTTLNYFKDVEKES